MENGSETGNPPIHPEINNSTSHLVPALVSSQTGLNPGRRIRFKPSSVQNLVTLATSTTKHSMESSPNFGSRAPNLVYAPIDETLIPPVHRGGVLRKVHKNSSAGGGIRIKSSIPVHQEPARPVLRPRKLSKVVPDNEADDNGEMWIKVPRNTNLFRERYHNQTNSNSNQGFDMNGGKKRGIGNKMMKKNGGIGENKKKNGGKKRGGIEKKKKNGGIGDIVSSIKLLGDGFMKMEKMKIDVVREIEKMRIEAEMKRNQMILESQKQIVDAFLKVLIDNKQQQQPPATTMVMKIENKQQQPATTMVMKKKPEGVHQKKPEGEQPRCCSHCLVKKTPQWRAGPLGANTLCNACGVRYRSGRLLPEYRPACSPTFSSDVHSNDHRKVLEMRQKKEANQAGLTPPVQSF